MGKLASTSAAACDQAAEPQVIVVVLLPPGAHRSGSYDQRIAQVYQLPFSHSDGLAEADGAFSDAGFAQGAMAAALSPEILARLARALEQTGAQYGEGPAPEQARPSFPALTPREREVLQLVLEGLPNKNIASTLQISMRTVENHRASIMRKTGSKSLPALVKLAIAAGAADGSVPTARPYPAITPLVRRGPADRRDIFMPN